MHATDRPAAQVEPVMHAVAAGDEARILRGFAVHRDLGARRTLVEAARQQPIVLRVAQAAQQARGHRTLRVDHDRLVDLNLVGDSRISS